MTIKKTVWMLLVGVAILFVFFTNKFEHEEHLETIPELSVSYPWRETLTLKKEYVAQIRAVQHIELRSYEKGYLKNIYVDEGQFVKKNQKMFQLMPLIIKADYNKSKAEYQIALIEYKNTNDLQLKNVVSVNELALSKAKLDKAKAVMNLAQTHLDFTLIKAPFDGIMDRFNVRLGSLVDEGELLTTLSDNSKVWVYFNVSESDYLNFMSVKDLKKKIPLELLLANATIYPYKGKIDTIEADFNNETGNIAFRASFPNPKRILRHGQTANIIISEKIKNALVIPQKATFEVLDKKYLYTVDKNNIVRSKQIKVIHDVPHLYIIESGVTELDRVLLEGIARVNAGQKIKVKLENKQKVKESLNLPVK